MNSIGNITFINQNQTTASTHIANKMANEDMQHLANAQTAEQVREQKEQSVSEIEVSVEVDDYLKEQKENTKEYEKKHNKDKKSNDKETKSTIKESIDFVEFSQNEAQIHQDSVSANGIFSSFSNQKKNDLDTVYEPLDIKV